MSNLEIMKLPIWRVEHVAEYLHLETRTIYNKVSKGEIPFYKRPGCKHLYFFPQEIENWVQGGIK